MKLSLCILAILILAISLSADQIVESTDLTHFNEKYSSGPRIFSAYAPPNFWGDWYSIASPVGSVTYKIEVFKSGNTELNCKVRYLGQGRERKRDRTITKIFSKSITISTGNFVSNVEVCFKGIPYGTVVRVQINP